MKRQAGRPSVAQANAISDAIVEATLNAFASSGFDFSVESVAGSAKISKQAIYRRWPSKVDLIIHAVERVLDDVLTGLEDDLPTDEFACLREIAWRLCKPDQGIRARSIIILRHQMLTNEELRRRFLRWNERIEGLLARHIAALTNSSEDSRSVQLRASTLLDLADAVTARAFWYNLAPDERASLFEECWSVWSQGPIVPAVTQQAD